MKSRNLTMVLGFVLVVATLAQGQTSKEEPPVTDADIHQHADKDIDNVDKIGSRNVGCDRGLFNWYSADSQIRMGQQIAQQIEQSSRMVHDPVINEYVDRIGQNLVRNSDAKVPFTIKVIESDEVNAFALPGGFFYVYTGLILAADEEAELAAVMAHEIGHVAACHAARQNTRGQWVSLATIPLIFVGIPGGYPASIGINQAAGIGLPALFLKFQRGFEAQADYLGLQYMYKAGYDPNAYITIFEKFLALQKKKPGAIARAFESHPQTPDRIAKTEHEIDTILPERSQYVLTSSEFDAIKARLAQLEHRKPVDSPDEKKPTLRRTADADKDGDGRPTLKKRDE